MKTRAELDAIARKTIHTAVVRDRQPFGYAACLRPAIQTTLDLYTQQDSEEARAAQGAYLRALRMPTGLVQ